MVRGRDLADSSQFDILQGAIGLDEDFVFDNGFPKIFEGHSRRDPSNSQSEKQKCSYIGKTILRRR